MPRPLGDAVSERLELPRYYTDFGADFSRAREFWKLERGQVYAEPGDPSWVAFNAGDWDEALRLVADSREDLTTYHAETAAAGTATWRIRIVELPVTPYLQWELHVLRLRDETGGPVRILPASAVADLEDQGELPDIYTMNTDVMYQAVYDEHGVLDHALRYTGEALVRRCRDFIAGLYRRGEPIAAFFEREIAHLPPPRIDAPSISSDYLKKTGRPQPIRS
jgi:hypothetical protein